MICKLARIFSNFIILRFCYFVNKNSSIFSACKHCFIIFTYHHYIYLSTMSVHHTALSVWSEIWFCTINHQFTVISTQNNISCFLLLINKRQIFTLRWNNLYDTCKSFSSIIEIFRFKILLKLIFIFFTVASYQLALMLLFMSNNIQFFQILTICLLNSRKHTFIKVTCFINSAISSLFEMSKFIFLNEAIR